MQTQSTFFKRTALSAAIIATLGLTACGGGGGSSSDSDAGDSSVTASSSGTAAKGIISGGIVTATELSSGNEVGTAITKTDGTYELTLGDGYQGGPVEFKITADADTQMKCDATTGCGTRADDIVDANGDTNIDFGEFYKPGEGGVEMRALIASASNGASISASITPFTEMAAQRAEEDGVSADSIAAANSEVTSLLGVNILQTPPVDITDLQAGASATEIAYAALTSAAANLAAIDSETGVIDVQAGIDALASSLSVDGIAANDDDTDESVISLQDILEEATATLNKADVEDTSGVIAELQEGIQGAGEDGVINPEPVPSATLNSVEKAKALVEDFRTYAMELDATISNPDFGGEFAQQIEIASNLLGQGLGTQDPIATMSFITQDVLDLAEFILDNYQDTSDEGTLQFPLSGDDSGLLETPFESGSMDYTIEINEDTGAYEITADFNNAVAEPYTVNLSYVYSGVYQETEEDTYNEDTGEGSYSYEETDNENISISGGIVSELTSLVITSGEVTEVFETGNYEYDNEQESGSYDRMDIGQFTGNATLSVLNEDSDTPITFVGELSADVMSKEKDEYSYNFDTNEYSDNYTDTQYVKSLSFDGTVAYASEEVALDVSVAMPNAETFFAMESGSVVETEEQWLEMNAGMGLTVNLASLGEVSLNLSASRSDFDKAEAEIRLASGDRAIVVSGSSDIAANSDGEMTDISLMLLESGMTGDIQVTDINGTVMTITPLAEGEEGVIGNVTIDGIVVATIEETEDGLIKTSYEDGTFEIY